MRSILIFTFLPGCLLAVCNAEGPREKRVIDELKEKLRWQIFWGQKQIDSGDRITLLRSSAHAAYCLPTWGNCLVFERSAVGDLGRLLASIPYDEGIEAGVWVRSVPASDKLAAESKSESITDPLHGQVPKFESEKIIFTSCSVSLAELKPLLPIAILLGKKPPSSRGLVGVLAKSNGIGPVQFIVPYFTMSDTTVFVILRDGNGVEEVLSVSTDGPWPSWRLRPLNLKATLSQNLSKKIKDHTLIVVSRSSKDW